MFVLLNNWKILQQWKIPHNPGHLTAVKCCLMSTLSRKKRRRHVEYIWQPITLIQYRCFILLCPSLRHLSLTDGTLWVVFYPRVTLKLGWKVVTKTHQDSMGGVNLSQEWTRSKRNLWWGVAEHMTSPAKREQRGRWRSIICLNKNNKNLQSKTQGVWNLNYPRHATVVSIKKKVLSKL